MLRCLAQDLRARAVPLPSDQLEVPLAHRARPEGGPKPSVASLPACLYIRENIDTQSLLKIVWFFVDHFMDSVN